MLNAKPRPMLPNFIALLKTSGSAPSCSDIFKSILHIRLQRIQKTTWVFEQSIFGVWISAEASFLTHLQLTYKRLSNLLASRRSDKHRSAVPRCTSSSCIQLWFQLAVNDRSVKQLGTLSSLIDRMWKVIGKSCVHFT